MHHVEHIRNELRKLLDEMHEVTRMLEQAEREKTISEDELEQLRESLRQLQSDRDPARYRRNQDRRPTPAREATAAEEEPEQEMS
jgi:predicted phage gp36 major capsid-like protein